MFNVDDKVRVVNDKTLWLNNQPEDTVLTVVSEYDDDHEIRQTQVSVNSANEWSEDFELVFSSSMAEPAFKVEPQLIVDGTQVFVNKAYIEKEATVRSSNQCEGDWKLNANGGFIAGFGVGILGEVPSEATVSKKPHDDLVDASRFAIASSGNGQSESTDIFKSVTDVINNAKEARERELGVYRPNLEDRKVGKVRVELVDDGFPLALREIAKVMTWAQTAKGYKDHDWQNLPNAELSLAAAASRHRTDHIRQRVVDALPINECVDHESELLHKAHEAFGVLAQLELMLRGAFDNDRTSG